MKERMEEQKGRRPPNREVVERTQQSPLILTYNINCRRIVSRLWT